LLNQGASVFPHLLGFLGWVIYIFLTTPASTAYSNISFSTASALASLLISLLRTAAANFSKNSGFSVKSYQMCAASM
jgi:hypothetical protein